MGEVLSVVASAAGIVLFASSYPPLRRMGCRLLFLALGLLLGCVSVVARDRDEASLGMVEGKVTSYVVRLSDDTSLSAGNRLLSKGTLLEVGSAEGASASARGSILVTGGKKRYLWGSKMRVHGTVKRAEGSGADWIGVASATEELDCKGYFLLRARAREWVRGRVGKLAAEDAGLFMALFLGVREDLGNAESYFFRRAGAVHLLALSGFHLGILSLILVVILSPLLGKNRALLVTAVGLCCYLFIAGPKVSLLRAVIMFTLLGLCRNGGLRARGLDLLSFTFLFNVLLWPGSLPTLSFQLSYLALAGIMLIGPVFDRAFASRVPKVIRLPFGAAIGALTATSSTLAARFGLIYPVGLLSGLILTPLVTAFVWGGLGIVFLPIPAPISDLLADALHLVHRLLFACAEFFSRSAPLRYSDWRYLWLGALGLFCLSCVPRLISLARQAREPAEEQERP